MRFDIHKEKRENATIDKETGLKYFKYELAGSIPVLMVWLPKAKNPLFHYRYKNEQERQLALDKAINGLKSHQERKEAKKKALKNRIIDTSKFKKGAIFYCSWGYDQTNYDYVVVLSLSATGKTVKCQRTSFLHMGESCQSNVQEPIFMPFGEIFNLKVTGSESLAGSYPFLHTGEGSKRYGYFSKHHTGKQYHETMAEFGH